MGIRKSNGRLHDFVDRSDGCCTVIDIAIVHLLFSSNPNLRDYCKFSSNSDDYNRYDTIPCCFFLPNGFFVEHYVIELCNKGMDYLLYWIHQLTALPFSNLKASEFSPYWLILIYIPVVIWYLYEEQNTVRKNFYDIQRTKKQSNYS